MSSISIKAQLEDTGVVRGAKAIKLALNDLKDADGKITWQGIKQGGKALDTLGGGMVEAGKSMTMGVTLPLVGVGTAAVVTAANFEDAMSQTQGALGLTSDEMGDLRQLALELGASTVFSAKEAGEAMVALAKGGMSEAEIKGGALQAAMDLAAAGNINLAEAADTTVQMMGSFGLSAADAASIADALAGAANASSADVTDLTQAMSQCSAQADLAGWSLEDTAAALALFADHGIRGSDAGTSLKTMLQSIAAPTDTAAAAMKDLGIEVRDSNGKMKDVGGIANELQTKLGGLSDAQRDAALQTIFGSDASRAAAILMKAGADGVSVYKAATEDATAAEDMAEAQKSELSWALENMSGAIETAGIAFGDTLAPAVEIAADAISDIAEKFSNLPSGVQTAIAVVLGLVATVGPLLVVFGAIIGFIPLIQSGMAVLGGAFTAVTLPVLAVVAAIGIAIGAIVYLWNTSESFRNGVVTAVQAIQDIVSSAVDYLSPYISDFVESAKGIVSDALNFLMPIIEGFFNWCVEYIIPIISTIVQGVATQFGIILSIVTGIMNGIKAVIQGVWNIIKGVFQVVLGALIGLVTGDFSKMKEGAGNIFRGIVGVLNGVWTAVTSLFTGALNSTTELVRSGFKLACDAASAVFGGLSDIVSGVMDDAKNVVSNALDAISGFFSGVSLELPKIALPHFSISGEFSLKNKTVPSISVDWYKTGAIAMGPSVVGVGEAGPEAIVPLHGPRMRPYAKAVAKEMGGAGGTTINIGDVTIDMSTLEDLATLEDFVKLLLRAKRNNPTKIPV